MTLCSGHDPVFSDKGCDQETDHQTIDQEGHENNRIGLDAHLFCKSKESLG